MENNKKMDPEETGWESVDWIYPAEDMHQWWAVLNMVMNPVSKKVEKYFDSLSDCNLPC